MVKPAAPSRWYLPWRHRAERSIDDPADLGTAFGLDLSLASESPPAPPAASSRRPGWVQRLTIRLRAVA